jgi:septal ring factor EnvC (AmiA/AmiB activator)
MTMLKGTGAVVVGGSFAYNFVQASEIKDLKRALEKEYANRAVLLRGIAGLTQKLQEARGNERRLFEALARAKATARQVKALLETAQAEVSRSNTESAKVRGESEAKTKELEVLKAKLEEPKKAA